MRCKDDMWHSVFSTDFIIRIYRYEGSISRPVVGVVERVGKKGKQAFHTYDELWEILSASCSEHRKDDHQDSEPS
jgi:hypothetical protein